MNKQIKYIFSLAVLILALSTQMMAGGPWPKGKGKTYLKLGEWWIVSDQHFTDNGQIDPNVTVGIFNTFLYGEHGFTDRLTGTLYFPFVSRTYMNNLISSTTGEVLVPGEAINSIGDTDVGLKYTLTKPGAKIPVSASLVLGLPLGNPGGGTAMNLQTGDGEFNQIVRFDAAKSFKVGKNNSYFSAYVGFNNRNNGFSDEFRFGTEWGVNLANSKLWMITRVFGVESFKNGTLGTDVNTNSIFANNTAFTSASVEAAYYVSKKVGFSANITGAFRGRIILASPSYSLGIFADL
ncbi:MAG: hypothetical protein AAFY71_04170 [Bacteroidota bacterium]